MPYEKVIAIGDSFTRGDELSDCPLQSTTNPFAHSKQTWPALIADALEVEYDCRSEGGRGNQWISNMVNSHIKFQRPYLYIVNWTYFGRFDFLDNDDRWSTLCPGSVKEKFELDYYKNFDNDLWNLHRNLQLMHSSLCLLKENNVDFIFTCQDKLFKEKIDTLRPDLDSSIYNHWKRSIEILQKTVVPTICEFEGLTFREWSAKHGYPIGRGSHPLEKAHIEAANYINMVIIEGTKNGHR